MTSAAARVFPPRLLILAALVGLVLAALLATVGAITASAVTVGTTTRVSVASDGSQASSYASERPSVSSDGRYVVFQSRAGDLVAGDTNDQSDIFLRDTQTGTTTRVSMTGGSSMSPVISADGRYVAYASYGNDLVAGDTNNELDVFRYDRTTQQTIRVSVATGGVEANSSSWNPTISADGRYVAYDSLASNLVAGDTNGAFDVFRTEIDGSTLTTVRVSVGAAGAQGGGDSSLPSISADGSRVAFPSIASDLVSGDTNGLRDIFVRDIAASTTVRVNVSSTGAQTTSFPTSDARISGDGRYVVFATQATTLVGGDNNNATDIFRHTLASGLTERVSLDDSGAALQNHSSIPSISSDGRIVAFRFLGAVWVRDTAERTTTQLDPGSNGSVESLTVAPGGGSVVYASTASNLVAGDTNGNADIFQTAVTTSLAISIPTATGAGVPVTAQIVDGGVDVTSSYVFTSDDPHASASVSGASITLVTAGSRTVTATPVGGGPALTATVQVGAGTATTLNTPSIGAGNMGAGSTNYVTSVTGTDAYGNSATATDAWGNATVNLISQVKILSSTDPQATWSGNAFVLRTAGVQRITVSLMSDGSVTSTSPGVNVSAGSTTTSLTPILSTPTTSAGQTLTVTGVTARDAYGNSRGDVRGQSEISLTSDPQAQVSGMDVDFRTAGVRTVTVRLTGNTSITGTASVTVGPGAPVSLTSATFSESSIAAGESVTLATVAGEDAYGNVIANVTAPIVVSGTTDPRAIVTGNSIEFRTAGSQTVTVALAADPTATATASITVTAGATTTLTPTVPADATAGSTLSVSSVTGSDAYGNSTGDVTLETMITATSDGAAVFFGPDIEFRTAGSQTLTITLVSDPAVTRTVNVTVSAGATATLTPTLSSSTATAGGVVTVTAVAGTDAFGNSTGDLTSQSVILGTSDARADLAGLNALLRTAGSTTLTVALSAQNTVTGTATVTVSASTTETLSATLSASTATAGDTVDVATVTGTDAFGNSTGDLTSRSVILSTTDPSAVIANRSVELRTAGSTTVTVALSATPWVRTTQTVAVSAGAPATLTPTLSANAAVAGTPVTVTAVTATDAYGNAAGDVTGQSVILSTTDTSAVISGLSVELRTAGSRTITVALSGQNGVVGTDTVAVSAGQIGAVDLNLSATTVDQGGSITFTVNGVDAYGNITGDVTSAATVTSDVATDIVSGGTVTFPTASPHTITATYLGFSTSVVVQVTPTPTTPPATGGGTAGGGLPNTGADITGPLLLAGALGGAGLLLLGAVGILRSRPGRRG